MCVGSHPFIPAPNTFRVQLIYTLFSQRIENVFHVLSGGGTIAVDADRIKAVFANWWNVSARPQVPPGTSLVLMVFDSLTVENGAHFEYTTGWTPAGTATSNALVGTLTTKIKFSTGFAGRSFRGGIFWPGIPFGLTTNGLLTAAYRDAVVAACNTLRTSLAAGGDALAVVSYCHNHVWRTTAVVTPVTSCSGHTTVNRQGRRAVPGS